MHGEHATYVVKIWQRRVDPSCQGHSYGKPVTDFLARHKCFGLERILATTTVQGREVGFSQISTGFPGTAKDPYRTTGQFSALVQKDGTGSINDLLREGYRLPSGPTSVPSPDAFDVLGQDNGIRIYDMWYLSGPTPNNAKPLETMSQDVFLQF